MADENTPAEHQPVVPITIGDAAAPNVPLIPDGKPADPAPVVDEPVAYEPTGDVGLDMALDFIGKAGVGIDHPAMKAAQAGDFDLLKATLAQKGVQGWEQFVKLGEAAYAKIAKETDAKAQATRAAIYKEAGGEAEWAAIQKWAGSNATPEEKTQINSLLNQGGLAAKSAVKYLVDTYNRANNVVVEPKDGLVNAGRGTGPAGNAGPLSPSNYASEVQALHRKLGGRMESSQEYASLQARRNAYRA
jgi:hypothetical protein